MRLRFYAVALAAFLLGRHFSGLAAQPTMPDIQMRDVLVLKSAGRPSRSPVHTDPIEALIVSGTWHPPVAGEAVSTDRGERVWEGAQAGTNGWLEPANFRAGYVYWAVPSELDQVMVLEAAGHNLVYVNGEIRTGDPYGYEYVHLPVWLHKGTNEFLFQGSRGRIRARLAVPAGNLMLNTADPTLPDIIVGEKNPVRGAVVLLNLTTNEVEAHLRTRGAKMGETIVRISPLSTRKAGFVFYPPTLEPGECPVRIEASARPVAGKSLETSPAVTAEIKLRVRRPDQTYKRTFVSAIDDSVQYYAVNPATGAETGKAGQALFLSLHGASVEAIGQADAYSGKKWGNLICPTNRRPYGFDWEEWGRMDALEVLALAEEAFHPDPTRIYLTGHSMGGHGTWQLGAIYPDHFAAIGPSAGWISFTSYVETNRPPETNLVAQILRRAAASSDTLLLASNYLQEGVYIIHGDADDNVPVREARQMREVLGHFHHDFDYHEQPGAGHWWDASDEPGADCVDWAPLFDFFAHHVIPADESLRRVNFTTVNPAVSARSHWVTILEQERALEPSVVNLMCDPAKRRVSGSTTNVAKLCLELPQLTAGSRFGIELDGNKLENLPWPSPSECNRIARQVGLKPGPLVCLARVQGQWKLGEPSAPIMKNPRRSGPFRFAFGNHVIFVYGTRGNQGENRWAFAKARYDAETFWYRGNGSVEVLSDQEFLHQPKRGNHSVILYGHAESNSAWPELLGQSDVLVRRGSIRVGQRELSGEDLACLFLQPFPGDAKALVGVVAGSGMPGLRLTERLPYFLSGAGFPDCLVVDTSMLKEGSAGVRLAGFFGPDWKAATGEFGGRD